MTTTNGTINQALKNQFLLLKLKWSVKDILPYSTTNGNTGWVYPIVAIFGFISNWNNQNRLECFLPDNL